jgi:hypothetical protein
MPGAPMAYLPALMFEFATGDPEGPPVVRAKVALIGDDEIIRNAGRLVHDSANGAISGAAKKRVGR